LTLTGTVVSFSIGGQELWIDDIRACPPCPPSRIAGTDFEDLVAGTTYTHGDVFNTGDITITVATFYWGTDCTTSPFTGGHARVDNSKRACGAGNDLNANNVNLEMDFGGPVTDLSLHYGHLGGNLNLTINGVCKNFGDFSAVDGSTLGGVAISAAVPAGCGALILTGTVTSFSIGGQELWIDDVSACVEGGPLFIRGDANADGSTDLGDPVFILNWQFRGGATPDCLDAADVNDDGMTDISDAIWSLSYQFLGGPPPPAPFPSCGPDPTPDTLGCASYPHCP
jgi:hypothetical protein